MTDYENNEEIKLFREYLRIPTVHPNIDYEPCLEFLEGLAKDLNLSVSVFRPANPKKPFLVMTWVGSKPELKAVLLHSHMDVVPVFEEYWTHPPFAADIDEDGKIFARGAQDMKCVGMQYLGAIRALKKDGFQPVRTIHISFGAEEELGGREGMEDFVKTEDFRNLNIGFSLDEGIASATEEFPVFYAERTVWRIFFKCNGSPGHGSLLLENTAGPKAQYILDKMIKWRQEQVELLENNPEFTIGDVTTINLTTMKGGVQSNVIPPQFVLGFDCRLAIDVDMNAFENQLIQWCKEAGDDVTFEYEHKHPRIDPTPIDGSNIFWVAFKQAIDELGLKIKTQVFPGGTDSRYIRGLGIPALGFSPMNFTPVLLHDHDEFIKAETYLKGIEIYKKIIPKVPCVKFFQRLADEAGLKFRIYAPKTPKIPIIVLTWEGTQPDLPAIMLNSHTDVVPVFEDNWSHPPFAANMDDDGKIYARGAQDMKCVGMQYYSTVRALKRDGFKPKRTIHLTYVPEEEIGGFGGMAEWVHQDDFKALNIGFSLDEGIASPTDIYPVFYAERAIWHVFFKCNGNPGHGSLLLENTAGPKVQHLLDRFHEYRETQVTKLKENPDLVNADVTTVNLTILKGGVQSNVIPPQFTVVYDIRLAIDEDHDKFEAMIKQWCEEAVGGIDIEFEMKDPYVPPTKCDDDNIYWKAFKAGVDELGLKINLQVFPGGTDSRYVRGVGTPALGFSPMNFTPVLLHDHNEFLKAETYLRGLEIYKTIIPKLANA